MSQPEFLPFPKIHRLHKAMQCVITEKIDGTNAGIYIDITAEGGPQMYVSSRNRFITPEDDNCGFARWCQENKEALLTLGDGWHHGEWWGSGIQRRYGQDRKRFSLFNTGRWLDPRNVKPGCCDVVPVLYSGVFSEAVMEQAMQTLHTAGSYAAPGFMKPEGIVAFFPQTEAMIKHTFEHPNGKWEAPVAPQQEI